MSEVRERLLLGGALALLAAGFAWLNGAERVDVNLGLVRVSDVPLPVLVFTAFILGMLTLFLASLKTEMRTKRRLQRYREALGAGADRKGSEVGADRKGSEVGADRTAPGASPRPPAPADEEF